VKVRDALGNGRVRFLDAVEFQKAGDLAHGVCPVACVFVLKAQGPRAALWGWLRGRTCSIKNGK